MSHEEEAHLGSDIAVGLVLSSGTTERDEEKNVPGKADFEEHLHVDIAKHARVELSTHEEIVDVVASHPVLSTTSQSADIGDDCDD